MRFLWVMIILAGQAAQAAAPSSSVRPMARGMTDAVVAPAVVTQAAVIRPRLRPALAKRPVDAVAPAPTSEDIAANTAGVAFVASAGQVSSPRPEGRPAAIVERAMARKRQARRGAVCGDIDLQGEAIGRVPGPGACGIGDAVALRSVAGVALSQRARMDCRTAKALKRWIKTGVKPAFGNAGGGVVKLRVAAHYACRTRNNRPGAKISEHGKGRAIDISAFYLRDGTSVTVLGGWSSKRWGTALRRTHKAACGPFGTVLGPRADRYHQDHFHMDTARYRSGSYCR